MRDSVHASRVLPMLDIYKRAHTEMGKKESQFVEATYPLVRWDSPDIYPMVRWDSPDKDKVAWIMTEDGRFVTKQKNTNLVLNLPHLPETIHVSASLSWKEKGDFAFSIGLPKNCSIAPGSLPWKEKSFSTGLRKNVKMASDFISVETDFGELALQYKDNFEPLQTLHSGSGQLTFHLRWNRQDRKATFFNANGKKVAEVEVHQIPKDTVPAIFIRNKTGDLSIDSIRIGGPSTKNIDFGQSAVCLVDGSRMDGEVVSYNERSGWKVKTANGQQAIPSAAFASVRFPAKEASQKTKWNSQFVYRDGSLVQGDLISINDQVAKLKTSFAEDPFECLLKDLSTIQFLGDAPKPETGAYVLHDKTNFFRGKLVSSDAGLHWCLVGSVNGLPLLDPVKDRLQIVNNICPSSGRNADHKLTYTTILRNFEQIHCPITEINENTVHFNLHGEDKQVEMANIRAILFDGYGRQPIPFSDKGWKRWQAASKTQLPLLDRMKHLLTLSGDKFRHPQFRKSSDVAFDLSFPANAELVSKGIKRPPVSGKKLIINYLLRFPTLIDVVSITIQPKGNRLLIQAGDWHGYHPVSSKGTTKFQTQIDHNKSQVLLLLDDQLVHKLWIRPSEVFDSLPNEALKAMFHLNNRQAANLPHSLNNLPFEISIDDLEGSGVCLSNVSVAKKQSIAGDKETIDLLLTVPRVQKLDPPKHILWAKNGDFLRGTLRSLSDKKIQFESNLETFTYPIDIASHILFLQSNKESSEPSQKKPKSPLSKKRFVQVELFNSYSLTFADYAVKEGHLRGSSDAIGLCKIPLSEIKKLHFDKDSRNRRFSNHDWLNKSNSKIQPADEQDVPSK